MQTNSASADFVLKDYINTRVIAKVIERFRPIVNKAIKMSLEDICDIEFKEDEVCTQVEKDQLISIDTY